MSMSHPVAPPPITPAQEHRLSRRCGSGLVVLGLLLATLAILGMPSSAPTASADDAGPASPSAATATRRWDAGALTLACTIPIQDGGRIMPLQTYAGYTLLQLNHKRTCVTPGGDSLTAIEWLLDILFRPSVASRYECFRIEDSEILEAIGLERGETKKKADRYSYADLKPAQARLFALADQLIERREQDRKRGIEQRSKSPVEEGILDLYGAVRRFASLAHVMDFARESVPVGNDVELRALFGGATEVAALEALSKATDLRRLAGEEGPHVKEGSAPSEPTSGETAARELRDKLLLLAQAAGDLHVIPPAKTVEEQSVWLTPGHVIYAALEGLPISAEQVKLVVALSGMQDEVADGKAFAVQLREFHDTAERMARARGEYDKVGLEVKLTNLDPFYRSVYLYLLAFVLVAVTWLAPNRWVKGAAWGALGAGILLHVTGIVIRCVLRERPPISTLYETALFIAALGTIALMIAELVNRRGVALALAPVFGALVLFLANKFEALKGEDTMPQLQAVLDTNFWLALHVTCINIGYAGGMLAAVMGHLHVLGRATGLKSTSPDFYRSLHRMTYGMLCFGLLFCVVGTILGGIWANDSWGRFWGWDPKENGALMICLSQLAILHARMGGYLKPFGFAMASMFSGCVIVFSWWGVNLLGIGLHAYGFTGGILKALVIFYVIEIGIFLTGLITYGLGRAYGRLPATPAA